MIMNNSSISELNNRNLDLCYFSVYCIPVTIYFNYGNYYINQRELYIFFGCNLKGIRKYIISCFKDEFTKTSDWYNFFLSLKKRNITNIIFVSIPDNPFLKEALSLAFNGIEVFYSFYDIWNIFYKYYSGKTFRNFLTTIRELYLSTDVNLYHITYQNFLSDYKDSQFIIDMLDHHLKKIENYYYLDLELRKAIFAFYFNRELIKKLMVISHSKPYFSSIEEFTQELIPIIQVIESKMYCSKIRWVNIINLIYSSKRELIKCYL